MLPLWNQLCHREARWPGLSPCPLGLSFPMRTTGGLAQIISKTVSSSLEGLDTAGEGDDAMDLRKRDPILGSELKL